MLSWVCPEYAVIGIVVIERYYIIQDAVKGKNFVKSSWKNVAMYWSTVGKQNKVLISCKKMRKCINVTEFTASAEIKTPMK